MKNNKMTTNDDNDDEIYPTVKITRGGELPEGATESGNEESDNDRIFDKTTKYDPHRALNINLNEESVQSKESVAQSIDTSVISSTEKLTKPKKKSTSKSKHQQQKSGDSNKLTTSVNSEEQYSTTTKSSTIIEEKTQKKPKIKEKS